jgi:hypothetical protein
MKEEKSNEANRYRIRRCGYNGSGFVFYFVRCADAKALADYVAKLPGGKVFSKDEEGRGPNGYCYSLGREATPEIIPEGFAGSVYETHILAVENDDARVERRHWYHEIGHAVNSCVDSHIRMLDVCDTKDGDYEDGDYEEAPAYFNEFLLESLDLFLAGSAEPTVSGLPFVMPWITEVTK